MNDTELHAYINEIKQYVDNSLAEMGKTIAQIMQELRKLEKDLD